MTEKQLIELYWKSLAHLRAVEAAQVAGVSRQTATRKLRAAGRSMRPVKRGNWGNLLPDSCYRSI